MAKKNNRMDDEEIERMVHNLSSDANYQKLIKNLQPYVEHDHLARLGLQLLHPNQILKYPESFYKLSDAGWAGVQDISRTTKRTKLRPNKGRLTPEGIIKQVLKKLRIREKDFLTKDGYVPSHVVYGSGSYREGLTKEEVEKNKLLVLAHELRHIGDIFMRRNVQIDDDPNLEQGNLMASHHRNPYAFRGVEPKQSWHGPSRQTLDLYSEPAGRLMDRITREKVGIPHRRKISPYEGSEKIEGRAFIPKRYRDDPSSSPAPDVAKHMLGLPRVLNEKTGRWEESFYDQMREYYPHDKRKELEQKMLEHPAQLAAKYYLETGTNPYKDNKPFTALYKALASKRK